MKTKLIPAIAITLAGFFTSASFAQEEVAPVMDQPAVSEEVAGETVEATEDVKPEKVAKEDPRADRAKERFERKDAKKAEIANHKAEKRALKEERAAAKAQAKAERGALKADRDALKAERDAMKAERKANRPSKDF